MKVPTVFALSLAALILWNSMSPAALAGDKKELQWFSFEQGSAEAQRTGKKLLVDVYTTWCGWCKKMDANTYGSSSVASYLKDHYILVKLNAESDSPLTYKREKYSEKEFARAFGVNGYPTTLFLKSNGDPITKYPGYADASKFRDIVSYIAEDHYLTKKFDEYLKGR